MSRVRRKSSGSRNTSSVTAKKQKTIDLGWKNENDDEHIDSGEDEDDYKEPSLDDEEDVEEEETLDAKKVRLAREYLRKLEEGESDESSSSESEKEDEDETEHDRVGLKLQRQRLKREGTLERLVAGKVNKSVNAMQQSLRSSSTSQTVEQLAKEWISAGHIKLLRGHDLTPTCVALQTSGEKAVSGSKDHSVILWDIEQERKAVTLCPTWKRQGDSNASRTEGEVLAVACSDDGRYATVGRRDSTVSIFDIRTGKNNLVKVFTGHKGAITSLAFRTQSLQMFSGSEDRCIR